MRNRILALVMAFVIIMVNAIPAASAVHASDNMPNEDGWCILVDRTVDNKQHNNEIREGVEMFQEMIKNQREKISYQGTFCKEVDDENCPTVCKEHAINIPKLAFETGQVYRKVAFVTDGIRHDPPNNDFSQKLGKVEIHVYIVGVCLDKNSSNYNEKDNMYRITLVDRLMNEMAEIMGQETKVTFYIDGKTFSVNMSQEKNSTSIKGNNGETNWMDGEEEDSDFEYGKPLENIEKEVGMIAQDLAKLGGWDPRFVQMCINYFAIMMIFLMSLLMPLALLNVISAYKRVLKGLWEDSPGTQKNNE